MSPRPSATLRFLSKVSQDPILFPDFISFPTSTALITALVVIVVTFVILMVVDLEPLTKQFLTSLVIGLLVTRLLWIFQSQLMLSLMLGYELDRALILRKSEPSLFEKISKLWVTSSGKVFASSDKGDSSTVPST
jgi:hypothetical protein